MAVGITAGKIKGSEGRITLPGVGVLVGEIFQFQLGTEGKSYVLRMQCNQTFFEDLWDEESDNVRIELHILKDQWYEARRLEGAKMERKGRLITIKGIELVPI